MVRKTRTAQGADTVRAHVWWHWQSQHWPGSCPGFWRRCGDLRLLTGVHPCLERSSCLDRIILVASSCLCMCGHCPSLTVGRKRLWHLRLAPATVLTSGKGTGHLWVISQQSSLTTRWRWWSQVCPLAQSPSMLQLGNTASREALHFVPFFTLFFLPSAFFLPFSPASSRVLSLFPSG